MPARSPRLGPIRGRHPSRSTALRVGLRLEEAEAGNASRRERYRTARALVNSCMTRAAGQRQERRAGWGAAAGTAYYMTRHLRPRLCCNGLTRC